MLTFGEQVHNMVENTQLFIPETLEMWVTQKYEDEENFSFLCWNKEIESADLTKILIHFLYVL